jgi:hypothetical protein
LGKGSGLLFLFFLKILNTIKMYRFSEMLAYYICLEIMSLYVDRYIPWKGMTIDLKQFLVLLGKVYEAQVCMKIACGTLSAGPWIPD